MSRDAYNDEGTENVAKNWKAVAYFAEFGSILDDLAPNGKISFDALMDSPSLPAVAVSTKKKHLRDFIQQKPEYLEKITGLFPKADTIIDLVEKKAGRITEDSLDQANLLCRDIVVSIAQPILEDFIRRSLDQYLDAETQQVNVPIAALTQFLLEEYSEFSRGAGNGLVSIAGKINELLLARAMLNAGLMLGRDFKMTGTDSDGDIVIHAHAGTQENLGVEVKSYHARERLLRGLQDVRSPKIGVGFFKNAAEFNPQRTVTLLQAQPAAIYMPAATLSLLDPKSAQQKTNDKVAFDSKLYRPLERYVSDVSSYVKTGILPHFG